MKDIRVLGFYLPQFHPFPENDEWWGKGFTEWTNVGKAKPLFKGHYQPKIPADLGYYDLRLPFVREQQALLAKEAGLTGFCYWHYWFGNGKRLMADIFDDVLNSKRPDSPFCLAWANHSWFAKNWNANGVREDKMLIEQTYPGKSDMQMHCEYLIKAFSDDRYIKVDGKPLFAIFDPLKLPKEYIDYINDYLKCNGFKEGAFFVAIVSDTKKTVDFWRQLEYDAVSYQRLSGVVYSHKTTSGKILYKITSLLRRLFLNYPINAVNYQQALPYLIDKDIDSREDVFPSMVPNWDHTPRSGKNGSMFYNSTPDSFKKHAIDVLEIVSRKTPEHQVVFLKSWNEWAEGNYIEPDLKYGKGYIKALRDALNIYK